jgi:hypothetical protein
MKLRLFAPLVLPALGGFALASKDDSNPGKALRGGSDGGGLFGEAAGEVSNVAHRLLLHIPVNFLKWHCFLIMYFSPKNHHVLLLLCFCYRPGRKESSEWVTGQKDWMVEGEGWGFLMEPLGR